MLRLLAPAKLNLWLRITGRRADGYHELDSLFTRVDLHDEIFVEEAPRDQVAFFVGEKSMEIPGDTISKALAVFRKSLKPTPHFSIKVQKKIPLGAGLGGGSTDAASVFHYLWEHYSPQTLKNLALEASAKVGADVPFFMAGCGAALVKGMGEIVKPIKIEKMGVVVIRPDFGISTPQAYRWFDEGHPWDKKDASNFHETLIQQGVSELTHIVSDVTSSPINETDRSRVPFRQPELTVVQIVAQMVNDLEKAVESRHPEISEMKEALRIWGALASLMSGSGSSVYGIYKDLSAAQLAVEKLRQKFPPTYSFFVCETA